MFILIGFVSSLLLGVICGAVAISKGRNSWLWGILGFFFGVITLIVIAALPGVRPQWRVVDTSAARSVRHCPQCNAENDLESNFCTNCGTRLSLEPEVEGRVVAPARFVTPLVGLLVGLIFALILLQATKPSAETILGESATPGNVERLRARFAELPPVVLFWPVSPGLLSFGTGQSPARLVWHRVPATLEIMILGGGLAVLLAWGLALGLRRRHPGITAGRLAVAGLAAVPVVWLGLMTILELFHYFDWLPPVRYAYLWDDPKSNLLQLFWPIYAVGLIGGLWTALEMRSREDTTAMMVLLRALGLVLRHGGMLLSGIILLELVFAVPGLGITFLGSTRHLDPTDWGVSAAVIIWLALLSRFLGNLLLAAVDESPPARTGAIRGTESGRALAIGGGVTIGLMLLLLLIPFVAPQDPMAVGLTDRLVGPGRRSLVWHRSGWTRYLQPGPPRGPYGCPDWIADGVAGTPHCLPHGHSPGHARPCQHTGARVWD